MLRVVLVAAICGTVFLMRAFQGHGFISFALILVYCFSCTFCGISVKCRVRDAGLPDWYVVPFSLIPFCFCCALYFLKAVSVAQALALFVILQIPTALLRSKPVSVEPTPQVPHAESR